MRPVTEAGVYPGVSDAVYHADPALSSTALRKVHGLVRECCVPTAPQERRVSVFEDVAVARVEHEAVHVTFSPARDFATT